MTDGVFMLRKSILKQYIYSFLIEPSFFVRRMYMKGYNYRHRLGIRSKYIRLYLGAPLSWVVRLPINIKLKKLRKKFFKFISFNWALLLNFCYYLKNLQEHLPYKRRGFMLTRYKVKRKIGKRSRR